ncbi:hypothetical protein JCM14469_23110 [Desulfatiferula olefinivorans]
MNNDNMSFKTAGPHDGGFKKAHTGPGSSQSISAELIEIVVYNKDPQA